MGAAEKLKTDPVASEIERIVNGTHADTHSLLGAHADRRGTEAIRGWRPDSTAGTVTAAVASESERIVNGTHADPHSVLGAHADGRGKVAIRVWRPDSTAVTVLVAGRELPAKQVHDAGVWLVELKANDAPEYRLRVQY